MYTSIYECIYELLLYVLSALYIHTYTYLLSLTNTTSHTHHPNFTNGKKLKLQGLE